MDGWMDGGIVTFIGVVERGGVEGAETGGLGLATLVSNGLQVVIVILMVFVMRKQMIMREGSMLENFKNEHSGLLGVATMYWKRIRKNPKSKKGIFCCRLQ